MKYNHELMKRIKMYYGNQTEFGKRVGKPREIVSFVVNGRWNLEEHEKQQWAKTLNTGYENLWKSELGEKGDG